MILLFTETQPVPGNVYSRRVPFQVEFHITNLPYSSKRQSFSAAFWITATAKKHTNLTLINLLGISWSKLVTCPSPGMITRCHKLMKTNSLFLEDSSLVPESTNATFVLRMAEHSTGSKLVMPAQQSQRNEHLTAQPISMASFTFSEVWMKTIRSFAIFGNLIWRREYTRRSNYQLIHLNPAPEADTAPAFLKVKCTFLVEYLSWLRSWTRCLSTISLRVNSKSLVATDSQVKRCIRCSLIIGAKRRLIHRRWEEIRWMLRRRQQFMEMRRRLRLAWIKVYANNRQWWESQSQESHQAKRPPKLVMRKKIRRVDLHHQRL